MVEQGGLTTQRRSLAKARNGEALQSVSGAENQVFVGGPTRRKF